MDRVVYINTDCLQGGGFNPKSWSKVIGSKNDLEAIAFILDIEYDKPPTHVTQVAATESDPDTTEKIVTTVYTLRWSNKPSDLNKSDDGFFWRGHS